MSVFFTADSCDSLGLCIPDGMLGAVQKEMGSPNYFKFTREFKSAKI